MSGDNVVQLHPPGPKALPCPFCGEADPDFEYSSEALEECWIICQGCMAQGPVATVGCRDDEDGEIDLVDEATELWNRRTSNTCWHCKDVLDDSERPHCERCPAECDDEACSDEGCREQRDARPGRSTSGRSKP